MKSKVSPEELTGKVIIRGEGGDVKMRALSDAL